MADFLYGKLNKTIEYLRYKFNPTDTATISEDKDHNLSVDVNVNNLVRLLQVKNDSNPSDDHLKYYKLFTRNPLTGEFDQELPGSDTIVIGEGSGADFGNITSLVINGVSVQAILDDKTGQLNIQGLPASVIVDTHIDPETGKEELIKSVLDGNAGGEVY